MNETIHERIGHLVEALAHGKNTVFAQKIGVSEANIRGYIKGIMPKADVLSKIVISYDVNALWLLTGTGEMYVHDKKAEPKPIQGDIPPSILQNFMTTIQEQAEEIGRLREQVRQLKLEKGRDASDATTSTHANVG